MLLHTAGSAAFAARFQGGLPEYLGYLGWPILAVLAVIAACCWRRLPVRATAVAFAVLSVFSLGGTLLAGGREHAGVMLPWHWLQNLPVVAAVIPDRFSIIADGAAAALLAFGLDAASSRWPRRRALIAAAAVIALLPLVPRPLPAAVASPVPADWSAAFAALRLPAGAEVLVVPMPVRTYTAPLRWQADTGVPSAMYGGYYMGPTWHGQPADRRQRAVFRGRLPEPALGAIVGRQRRRRSPRPRPWGSTQTPRRCGRSWPAGSRPPSSRSPGPSPPSRAI